MKLGIVLFFAVTFQSLAQPYEVPQVPHKMNFAGITLTIRDDARREIQKEVNALWQSPKHFNIKAERAKTYFPIIENIFAEERVPDDFKYLVLQESALIADAVSVSNAVGFWQFKDFTAHEMGLRVDNVIDERMNIYSATRGAARYLKRNNYQFNNWVYALQAYQMGAGGVMRSVRDVQSGTRHMEITSSTYWYVKKFLAHKVAFENSVKGNPMQTVSSYENKLWKSIADVATDLSIDANELLAYNKWIRRDFIPNDKTYSVIVPSPERRVASEGVAPVVVVSRTVAKSAFDSSVIKINGVSAIIAQPGESMTALAKRADVSLPTFMEVNDLSGHEKTITNMPYFIARKKSKAEQLYAEAKPGESLWSISQRFGVSLSKLKKYNRTNELTLTPGEQVWLSSRKPKTPANESEITTASMDEKFFSWSVVAPSRQGEAEALSFTEISYHQQESVDLSALSDNPIATTDSISTSTGKSLSEINKNIHHTIKDSIHNQEIAKSNLIVPKYHLVQPGENLYALGQRYGFKLEDMIKWNNLGDNLDLSPGQKIYLSDNQHISKSQLPDTRIHEVKPSDTLYSIARQYDVTIKQLMDWNNKKDFSLTVGEKLRVAEK